MLSGSKRSHSDDENSQSSKRVLSETGCVSSKYTIPSSFLRLMDSIDLNSDQSTSSAQSFDGCSDYDQSDASDCEFPKTSSKLSPLSLLASTKIQTRFQQISSSIVNHNGAAIKVSTINSVLYPKWISSTFNTYAYRYNSVKKSWTRKGPVSVIIQNTWSGNARITAHYLYGTCSTMFNMKMHIPFLKNAKFLSNSFIFSTNGRSVKTVVESTYHQCNLTGSIVNDTAFKGNYNLVLSELKAQAEDCAQCFQLVFPTNTIVEFKDSITKIHKNYLTYEYNERVEMLKNGANFWNSRLNSFTTGSIEGLSIELMDEMASNGFTLASRKTEDARKSLQAEFELHSIEAQFIGRTVENDLCVQCASCSMILPNTYNNLLGRISVLHSKSESCDFILNIS